MENHIFVSLWAWCISGNDSFFLTLVGVGFFHYSLLGLCDDVDLVCRNLIQSSLFTKKMMCWLKCSPGGDISFSVISVGASQLCVTLVGFSTIHWLVSLMTRDW